MSRKSRAKPPSPLRCFNSSPEIIRLVVLMYVRFPLIASPTKSAAQRRSPSGVSSPPNPPTSKTESHCGESGSQRTDGTQQIDARVRTWIVPERLRFEVGAVWLAKGRFLREAPNGPPTGDSKYLSLNLTANL
jgi:hypothetical protein